MHQTGTEGTVTKGPQTSHEFAQSGQTQWIYTPFITNTLGKFRANPANFVQIRPSLTNAIDLH